MSRTATTNNENAISPTISGHMALHGHHGQSHVPEIFGDGGPGEGSFFKKSLPPKIAFT